MLRGLIIDNDAQWEKCTINELIYTSNDLPQESEIQKVMFMFRNCYLAYSFLKLWHVLLYFQTSDDNRSIEWIICMSSWIKYIVWQNLVGLYS